MFSKGITERDDFIDLPLTAQALYFHLGMEADDEGFVSPQRIVRMIGAKAIDLKMLAGKGLVIPFESGVIVMTHWNENNYIQSDRKKDTMFKEERLQLAIEDNVYRMYTECTPRLGKVSIGKDRLGEVSLGKDTYAESFDSFWLEYPKKISKSSALKIWLRIKPDEELATRIVGALKVHKESSQWLRDGGRFIPHPSTWLNQGRWEDEIKSELSAKPIIL